MFGLRVQHPPDYGVEFKSSARIKIYIKKADAKIFRLENVSWSGRFEGNDMSSGVIWVLRRPRERPFGVDVDFHFIVKSPDPFFGKRYGKAYFFIRRASDV